MYIGVDWGDERHSVHLQAEGNTKIEHFELEQKPDVLHEAEYSTADMWH